MYFFFFSSRRRHTRWNCDWSSDVCSSDLEERLVALCHIGANVVPSGESCSSFADATARGQARMIIGEQGAVDELWGEGRRRMPNPRDDRPGQPVYVLEEPPEPGETGLRAAR